jgi:VWFA-related protein
MKKALLLGTLVLASLTLAAQTPTTLRVDVRLVNVVTTVTDADGKFVANLKPDDFTLLEDGVEQKITHFTQDRNIPVSVGILLDTSGSMADKMRAASGAVQRFLDNIHPEDDIFLMTFAKDIHLEQDFTSDRKKLAKAMASLKVGGTTLLYEALKQAIDKVHKGRHDKRAILVISDGMDAQNRPATLGGTPRNHPQLRSSRLWSWHVPECLRRSQRARSIHSTYALCLRRDPRGELQLAGSK